MDLPLYTEGVDSNQPLQSHSNSLPYDPHLYRVEVNKFNGLDPTTWVTHMEHYLSLHGITDELTKLHAKGMFLGHNLLPGCMNSLTWTPTI